MKSITNYPPTLLAIELSRKVAALTTTELVSVTVDPDGRADVERTATAAVDDIVFTTFRTPGLDVHALQDQIAEELRAERRLRTCSAR